MMVKKHFISRYGKPIYTIGVGGSGGSIQQYHIAQNYPGLLDGGVPQYSYSDMITQTIYVGDCSLMEYYFDIVAPAEGDSTFGGFDPLTQSVIGPTITPRTWIEGMSSSDDEEHEIYTPLTGGKYRGSTECVEGWLGLLPLVINPLFTNVVGLEQLPDDVVTDVKWTHWDDLKNIYGENEQGYAPNTWDNVGVQYGLQALKENKITLKQFLDINAKIGGWKQPWEMVPEGYPFSLYNTIQYLLEITPDPKDFDPWSIRNANIDTDEKGVAPRTTGNIDAMHAAYQSGHVFIGRPVDGSEMIPLIDFRHYLDPVLDMHHAQQSFATRERLLEGQGHADNQLIWFAKPYYDLTMHAFDVLDEWIYNIQHKVYGKGVVVNRPDDAEDMCVDAEGNIIGEGPDAWDGILDDNEPGPCTSAFPLFSTSRIIAGGNMGGDVFKCQLIPVREAVERGFYDPVPIDDETLKRLEEIFPDGVCDYSKGDAGRPDGF
ncbi:MAG: hypothetical protein DRJ64_09485 [Thermoprotei archaeon]|nr:MAG: hypothetical protein DRJ64_09485 [Thermoprotei archaeon]